MLVLHSLNSGKDILPAQGSLQISKEEDSSLQMTHPMNKQVRVREDCLEEVQESWVCSSNDREDIQVKKAHLEGVINKDKKSIQLEHADSTLNVVYVLTPLIPHQH